MLSLSRPSDFGQSFMTVTRCPGSEVKGLALVVENTSTGGGGQSHIRSDDILHGITSTTCYDMVDDGGEDRSSDDVYQSGSVWVTSFCGSWMCWHRARLACSSMFRGSTVSARVWHQEMVGEGGIQDTFSVESKMMEIIKAQGCVA